MQYDFDKMTDRNNTGSMKWAVNENELPMWVADMDFETAPAVKAALERRVSHGIFGYTEVTEEWYQAIISWWEKRHNFSIKKEWLIFSTGVVPSISSVVRKMTTVGENVLILTPVYNIFYNSILNNGRHVLESKLVYESGEYHIDFADLEEKLSNPQTTLLLLCNPHNPTGNIWDRETLQRIGELCSTHNVLVLSDEIHCDLTDPGFNYIPFASASETNRNNSVTCIAPTKAFNIAGLQTSAVIVPNPVLRHKVNRGLNTDEVAEPNAFAVEAAIAAFQEGEEWLEELRQYLLENKKFAISFFEKHIPQVKPVISHATYLMWLDLSEITADTEQFCKQLRDETGLYLSHGSQFGGDGNFFVRLNVACPRKRLEDGLERLRSMVVK